jgi:glycerol-3-phosphate dehydrogenase (NAD(P)+)
LIGQGLSVQQASEQVGMVVEGIRTMEAAYALAQQMGIEMPLTQALYDIIHEGASVSETITELMERDFKQEFNL